MNPMIDIKVTKEAAEKFVLKMKFCGWTPVRENSSSFVTYISFKNIEGKTSMDYEVIIMEEESFIRIRPATA